MTFPRLYAIVDQATAVAHGWTVVDLAQAFLDGGARWLQIRAPKATGRELLTWCEHVVARAVDVGALVIVNDRVDVARLTRASGVHLGQRDLPVAAARDVLGPNAIVGLSTHTVGEIDAARGEPIDYVAVGPVFGTATKDTGHEAVGVELVRYAVTTHQTRPVVAIGGITLDRAPEVVAAGARSVAVISDLVGPGDPANCVAAYARVLSARSK